MSKIVAVHGATGTQGSGVIKALANSNWKVRALTRKPDGDSAKALVDAGVEVVAADLDDEASLAKAYEGVDAIFLVTNFWEHLFSGSSAVKAGELEAEQAMRVIRIAAKLPNLKHFIWSTLPGNAEGQAKRVEVQHFDCKAEVDARIRKEFPELAKKTTFLYVGYYANNIVNFPFVKPHTTPGSYGNYLWFQPASGETVLPSAGDASVNVGIFTKAILEQPEKTMGKYVGCIADTPTMREFLGMWSKASGKQAAFVEVNGKDWSSTLGDAGLEFWLNMKAFQDNPKWAFDNDPLGAKDLGIENQIVTSEAYLNSKKETLV